MNTNTSLIPVNTIFQCSWGYDQTNVDYYQVTKVNPSGKTITVRQINSNAVHHGDMTGHSTPILNSFCDEPMTKRVKSSTNKSGSITYSFKVNSFSYAFSMTDTTKPNFFSYGH